MKAKKKAYDYSMLRRKIFGRALLITGCAVATVILFRMLSHGSFANGIVAWIELIFSMDHASASILYRRIIPNNLNAIIGITIIVFMLFLFRMLLNSYTKYFDEVVLGIDRLMKDDNERIVLSSELRFVEDKLNSVSQTLTDRALEAQQAEQQKNDLVVYLVHDIKTPLTSVIGYLSLLDEAKDLPDEHKAKYTHIALEKANRLETLVNEFFEITRYNLQSVPLNKEKIDLGYMMVQITDELYPQLSAQGKTIELNIDESISIFGDAEKLARVFNNILKNAVAYSNEKSLISVTAQKDSNGTIIRFKSEGAIPEDKLGEVFDKFNRLNAARSSETGGAGLGLAIAKDIVTAHGGSIRAESNATHTEFVVRLPS